MEKKTRLSIQWFYDILQNGECDILDFKEQLGDKLHFGKSIKNFAPNYEEMARDVIAFANLKGGFIVIGIIDDSKEINKDFKYDDKQIFKLIKNIQDRTEPSITLKPYKLDVQDSRILVLEIPFSNQLHRTSRGEYFIRSNDGNRSIEPHEISSVLAEKGLIVYDQKTWELNYRSTEKDAQSNSVPGWQDIDKSRDLYMRIKEEKPQSPYLKNSQTEFAETLGLVKEENQRILPTTAGILFIGNTKALKELPYNQIKYIRYYEDGTYKPFEYSGNIINMIDECFVQLKAEIKITEYHYGLFREYVEDYSEVVLRELLVNAVAHRDYSRQQIIEIRKYPDYIEFESPGHFPQGIDSNNFLRKTNPRNPSIMDVLREINYAEKAGSGFDKIFTSLLSKGKALPASIQNMHSITFRVGGGVNAEIIGELSYIYKQETKKDIDLEKLLILNSIYTGQKLTFQELENQPFINRYQLRKLLVELQDLEFIEATGKTSGIKYIIHRSRLKTTADKIRYTNHKKQEKARRKEAVLRYLDDIDEIDNEQARRLLKLSNKENYVVSRLFAELKKDNLIREKSKNHNSILYEKIK